MSVGDRRGAIRPAPRHATPGPYRAGVLLVHAGNRIDADDTTPPRFPMSQVGAVSEVVARLLGDLRPTAVVSSPANGADLIVLSEAQRQSIDTHVVLPLPVDSFLRWSVAHPAAMWQERYQQVLEHARGRRGSTLEMLDLGADPEWYLTATYALIGRARAVRTGDDPIVALTVRPADGQDPPSVTDRFAARAAEDGITVLTLDPRPGRTASIQVC